MSVVVLVIGATGQVGRELVAELNRRTGAIELVATSRSHPDPARQVRLERPDTIDRVVEAVQPDHLILAAAATDVAWCEAHPDESRALNVVGPEVAAVAARRVGASFTFISTDYVFDGIGGPYAEDASTHPINVYGAHKLRAEAATFAVDRANLVVRTSQVFGNDPRRMNFVLRVADRLRAGDTVEAPLDMFGTPTYAPDLARAVVALTLSRASGIWNVGGDTFLSRSELAMMVADAFNAGRNAIVEFSAAGRQDAVKRPLRAGLRNGCMESAGMHLISRLPEALAEVAARDTPR